MNKLKPSVLTEKLEQFIKKYYTNQLLRGVILAISLAIFSLVLIAFLEYLGRFNSQTRAVMFFALVLFGLGLLFFYVVRPIAGLINIRRKLDYKGAAKIIGNHFPEVKDKLINTLQLENSQSSEDSNTLLAASIAQKTAELRPVPFSSAVNFNQNLKYVKYALLPAAVLVALLIVFPGFKSSTERVVKYNTQFEEQAPFTFEVNAKDFSGVQNDDIIVKLSLNGSRIPNESYINIGNVRYKMNNSEEKGSFEYTIKNIQKTTNVYFDAGGFKSQEFNLKVARRPRLVNYYAKLDFPAYLKRAQETVRNVGEITIPQGTVISWFFETENVDELKLLPGKIVLENKNNRLSFKKKFNQSEVISVVSSNKEVAEGDSLLYAINVIPDAFPTISVDTKLDSNSAKLIYFIGQVSDDYGFSKLQFNYKKKNEAASKFTSIKVVASVIKQTFSYVWDLNSLNINNEDEIEYYFTVWDNDGVNGAKSSKTEVQTYKAPSIKEIEKAVEKANEEIKSTLNNSQKNAAEMEKEAQKIERMLTEKKKLDWDDKKKIEDFLKKQKELEKALRETIEQNKQKNQKEQEFKPQFEDILEKEKKLEEMMEKVLDPEMKELTDKIEKLLQENQKDKLQQEMENFKFSEKEMNKELDRLMELFKELEFEKKLKETINKLDELAKEQKNLAEKTKKEDKPSADLLDQQKKLNEKFEDVKKDLEDLQKKNEALEKPKDINPSEDKQKEAQDQQNQGTQKLKEGKNSKASENQDNAAKKMQEMSDELQEQMDEAFKEEEMEDYNALRQILENLVDLSHQQEEVINGFKSIRQYSDAYVKLKQQQRKIKDDTKIVEDSLAALAKRRMEIQKFVNDELISLNRNIDKSLDHLSEQRTYNALVHQQGAMTNFNNLALMLSESLKQMQEKMKAQQKKGQGKPKPGSCSKPGEGDPKPNSNSKPNAQSIKKMQQELAKQLEQMQQGSQKGESPTSKQFAETAAKQAAIRKQIRDLERKLTKEGKGGSLGNLKQTQDMMDQVEKDLYNKRINSGTLQKLQQIEIKLSEHEKAERQQEMDDKRTSNEGKDLEKKLPPSIQKYIDEKNKELEQLQQVSPELKPYYENKVKKYFAL